MEENIKCDCMNMYKDNYSWYTIEGLFVMPCVKGTTLRINYCPSCGEYVRDIAIKKTELTIKNQ